ncbi:MADS-box transcription factor [Trema orientale]|uniref:MADS-box transcription factor n=1 Tax=Trema orientale TaxID=63057 RepID=A0A2P5F1B3_TREOI|nr:MADS-box transcription factor [Trema orientale]
MGRGKIEIKRIENTNNRSVTYSKRRNGIIKKAREISVLCDAKVSLIICTSGSGKMYAFCSESTSLSQMLEDYHRLSGNKLWDPKHEQLSNEIERIKKENENMLIELRHLKGEDILSLNHKELISLEDLLENGLVNVRARQSEFVDTRRQNDEALVEENKRLISVLYQKEMELHGSVRDHMDNGYNPRIRDYNSQMTFAFRVQPMQPNLQERI